MASTEPQICHVEIFYEPMCVESGILPSHGMMHSTLETTIWSNFDWALPIIGLHFGIDTLGQDETSDVGGRVGLAISGLHV